MHEFLDSLSTEFLIELNKEVGVGLVRDINLISSSLSSMYYEDTDELRVASIYKSLVKNHGFVDGNKRTATLFLLLSRRLKVIKLNLTDDELFDLVILVATTNMSTEDISSRFNKM